MPVIKVKNAPENQFQWIKYCPLIKKLICDMHLSCDAHSVEQYLLLIDFSLPL